MKALNIKLVICLLTVWLLSISNTKAQNIGNKKIDFLSDTTSDFAGLIHQFKGKVIYVDFWATWCHACVQELRNQKYIKAFNLFASKNNIVQLYICCDKNSNSWKYIIKTNNLIGYHTLINEHIEENMHTTYAVSQLRNDKMKRSFYIPRHMIIDQNGAVVDSSANDKGSKLIYSEINKLLQ